MGVTERGAGKCTSSHVLTGVDSEELYKSIQSTLSVIMCDESASLEGRAACAEALGLCTFIAASEVEVRLYYYLLENSIKNGEIDEPEKSFLSDDVYK